MPRSTGSSADSPSCARSRSRSFPESRNRGPRACSHSIGRKASMRTLDSSALTEPNSTPPISTPPPREKKASIAACRISSITAGAYSMENGHCGVSQVFSIIPAGGCDMRFSFLYAYARTPEIGITNLVRLGILRGVLFQLSHRRPPCLQASLQFGLLLLHRRDSRQVPQLVWIFTQIVELLVAIVVPVQLPAPCAHGPDPRDRPL